MKWNDLTMKEKSDLMSLFLQHGVSSLSDMKNIYNDGGYLSNENTDNSEDGNTITLETVDRGNNEALNKYKETEQDPLLYDKWHDDLQKSANYLINKNIREGDYQVYDWIKSYVNSAGYDRIMQNQSTWWTNRHPYRKLLDLGRHLNGAKILRENVNKGVKPAMFDLDFYTTLSFAQPNSKTTYTGTYDSNKFPYNFVTAHELSHLYNNGMATWSNNANGEALLQNTNTEEGHDSLPKEKHSDILGLKYLLYKEGIYDARGKEDVTEKQVKQLREKYPELRPLIQMSDDKAAWMINHVASNNTSKSSNIFTEYAKYGGLLREPYNNKHLFDEGGSINNDENNKSSKSSFDTGLKYNLMFNYNSQEYPTNYVELPKDNNKKYLTEDNYLTEHSKFRRAFEQYYPEAYYDSKGKKYTIGTGLTYIIDSNDKEIPVKKGDKITEDENYRQLKLREQRAENYARKKSKYYDNYHPELKFQILDAMFNVGNSKTWNSSPKYQTALRKYEEDKGWENPEYDLIDIFKHADWNLNDEGWLGVRSRMRRNPQSIVLGDYDKIYFNQYRDSLRNAYDKKFDILSK